MMLNVKDVVYLLDKKTQTLVPCLVVEIISSVSIDGEKTYHIVESPAKKKLKLENYGNPWFSSIEEAQAFLMETASSIIQKTVDKAILSAKEVFGIDSSILAEQSDNSLDQESLFKDVQNDGEHVKIDLGDGQIANVRLPSEIINEKNSSN